jgi:hypothetical protein
MTILFAADDSADTKRMLAYVVAHDEWLRPHHRYTMVHAVPKIPSCVFVACTPSSSVPS